MKIWTVTIDNDEGTSTDVCFTEELADTAAWTFLESHWQVYHEGAPMPDKWRDAANDLDGYAGFFDTVQVEEHDISAHPAISGAIGALMLAADRLGVNSYHGDEQEYIKDMQEAFIALQSPPKPRPFIPLVMLHGITNLPEGGTQHFDAEHDDEPDGWNVWLRRDYHDKGAGGEVFDDDTTRERFFDDIEDAREYAGKLAIELQCEVEEY